MSTAPGKIRPGGSGAEVARAFPDFDISVFIFQRVRALEKFSIVGRNFLSCKFLEGFPKFGNSVRSCDWKKFPGAASNFHIFPIFRSCEKSCVSNFGRSCVLGSCKSVIFSIFGSYNHVFEPLQPKNFQKLPVPHVKLDKNLSNFMEINGKFAKTQIFCYNIYVR